MEKKTEIVTTNTDNLAALQEILGKANALFHARGYMSENELRNLLVYGTLEQPDKTPDNYWI